MLQSCPQCGAQYSEHARACSACDASLDQTEEFLEPVAVPSGQPQWRREVAHRLRVYRARRHRVLPNDSQAEFPFPLRGNGAANGDHAADRPAAHPNWRGQKTVPVEIAVQQHALDFSSLDDPHFHPHTLLLPVAGLRERFWAGVFDLALLLLAYIGFLVLFHSLGGHFSLGKSAIVVYALTIFLFYGQYFSLFTVFDSCTPGMRLCGLSVVSFDGNFPSRVQLLRRSFGYLLSGGTLLLGFLWSLWDEDHLSWQDRISQTYITYPEAEAREPRSHAGTEEMGNE